MRTSENDALGELKTKRATLTIRMALTIILFKLLNSSRF